MLVEEIMSEDFATVDRNKNLHQAVRKIVEKDLNNIVMTDSNGGPVGIVTQKKSLVACLKTKKAIHNIPLSGFSTGFKRRMEPSTPVLFASSRMVDEGVEVLPVQEGMSIVGVLTKEDIVRNVSNLRKEALENSKSKNNW
jgi:tRNA nucleotidyltransferase (CCA-adding enzyme)